MEEHIYIYWMGKLINQFATDVCENHQHILGGQANNKLRPLNYFSEISSLKQDKCSK